MNFPFEKMSTFFGLAGIIAFTSVLTSCFPGARDGYHIEDGKVVLYKGFPASRYVIEEADSDSFEDINDNYGKDKDRVFYLSHIIPNADPVTFRYLGGSYSKDKNHGYSRDQVISNDGQNFNVVPNPDETSNNVTAQGIAYARDSKHVFKDIMPIEGADPATFRFVPMFNGYYLTHDRHHVYFQDRPMEGVDGSTFRRISEFHFCTKTEAWGLVLGKDVTWHKIPNVDIESFTAAGRYYSKDKNHVYYSDYQAKNADPKTFNETEMHQGKDQYRSYSSGYSAANKN
jgi:hypothetical protein